MLSSSMQDSEPGRKRVAMLGNDYASTEYG